MKFEIYILFTLIIILGIGCENDLAEVQRIISKEETGIEKAKGVEILYSDSAVVRVRIKSLALYNHLDNKNPRMEFPEGLEVDFFDNNKVPQSKLCANYAVRYPRKYRIVAQDSVVITNNKGEQLETEELIWDERKGEVSTDKLVKISTPKETIWGYRFKSNQDFSKWSLDSISGHIQANEDFSAPK